MKHCVKCGTKVSRDELTCPICGCTETKARMGKWIMRSAYTAMIVGLAIGISTDSDRGFGLFTIGLISLLVGAVIRWKEEAPERNRRQEEIRRKHEARMAENQKNREKLEAERQEREAKRKAKVTIAEVKYLGAGRQTQSGGGLGGAIVGGMVAGPLGAVVGATAKKNDDQKQRFAVKYGDGRIEIKEVHPNSWEYKELMKHVKWEDLG